MKTTIDQLKFAIEFAQADLKAMRPGDKMNLRDDLFLFASEIPFSSERGPQVKPDHAYFKFKTAAREMPEEQIEELRVEFLNLLSNVTHKPTIQEKFKAIGKEIEAIELPSLRFYALPQISPPGYIVVAVGEPRDVLLYRLIRLLESSADIQRLRVCPGCQRIFLKVKRQKYCSQKCANRSYMREYRAIGGEKDANHTQYEKRKQARPRRPRRS